MLATLLLFAAASSLIWQALESLARIERRLADTALFSTEEALRIEWLRQAIFGVQTGVAGDPLQARGDPREFFAHTSRPPWPGTLGPEPMRLWLEAHEGTTRVLASRATKETTKETTIAATDETIVWPLWSWSGSGHFLYLDHVGQWHERWPPFLDGPSEGVPPPRLPRALRIAGLPGGDLLVAVPAGNNPMPRRIDIEQ
jgi:hypothetical protein